MDIQELFKSVRAIVDAKIAAREKRRRTRCEATSFEAEALCCCETCAPMSFDIDDDADAGRHARRFRSAELLERKLSALGIRRRAAKEARLPEGLRVPSPDPRPPHLNAVNLSFAARLVIAVRDKFSSDAPKVYAAAKVSRQAYSQIISDETRPVSKRTAIRFAFALKCTPEEAKRLLKSAGFAFSNSQTEDFILQACLEVNPPIWDLDAVNKLLQEYRVDFQY